MEISVKKSTDFCTCSNCNTRNYESTFNLGGKVVDTIYDVRIGCMVSHLCPDCLAELIGKATVALATK